MQHYKFRGKRIDNGYWAYGSLIQWPDGEAEIAVFESGEAAYKFSIWPETTGMWTGLKDKNGREIYEGDIIEWNRGYVDDSPFDLWPNKPYICKFGNGKFFLHCTPNGTGGYVLSFDNNKNGTMVNCEIIGTIHEQNDALATEGTINMTTDPKEPQAEGQEQAGEQPGNTEAAETQAETLPDSEEGQAQG